MLPEPLTKRLLSKVHINNMFHISKQRLRIMYSFMKILWLVSITFIFYPPTHQKVSECLQRQLHNNQSMYCKCSLLICKTGFINFMQSPGLVKWSPISNILMLIYLRNNILTSRYLRANILTLKYLRINNLTSKNLKTNILTSKYLRTLLRASATWLCPQRNPKGVFKYWEIYEINLILW